MDDPAHPVLLNTWKHHAGWIRWRVGRAVADGPAGVAALVPETAVIGRRLMDLYTGPLTPAEIGEAVVRHLREAGRMAFEPLAAWLASRDGYALIDLLDESQWAIRLGPAEGRYLHLHPGRWVPHTVRVSANTLKSAIFAHTVAGQSGRAATDLAVVNEARRQYLGLLPVRELSAEGGLGAIIALLGESGA